MVVTKKCDAYSFGAVALETIMGRHPGELLSSLASQSNPNVMLIDVLDPRLPPPTDPVVVGNIVLVAMMAFACVHSKPRSRPTMQCVSQEFLSRMKTSITPLQAISLLQLWNRELTTSAILAPLLFGFFTLKLDQEAQTLGYNTNWNKGTAGPGEAQTGLESSGQHREAVVALPIARAFTSRPSKCARTASAKLQCLVDEENTMLLETTLPSPKPMLSDWASPSEWAPKITYKNRAISITDSVVAKKDHTLAMQENHIAHKRVLELRKTARSAVADASAKSAELNEAKQRMAKLKSENARLTGLVNAAEADKQKALAEMTDHYLRELAKLEKKKDAEITELKKKMEDAEDRGYKEVEATYVLQCEAAKDIFFKCE
ncbi:hypothetical protein HYC85_029713 [Camellia sinensis]|uniref:non-specific serine/threonine protein kinase n=1 Tax=Camellia sinensis TaxID=4442 RepID=A0A7J7FYQ9_CAMSI|nr:hypothetical protein HYC85_029713 [Camellia sinensis]